MNKKKGNTPKRKENTSWWEYIRTFDFWKQIAIMIFLSILIVFVCLFSLSFFTHHGQKIKVPDMSGYTVAELEPLAKKYSFKFVIRDSVFDEKSKPGSIIAQTPREGSIVKKHRTFYVVVAAYNRASLKMPDLVDLSYRQAVSLLETYGLQAGAVSYVPSMANGAVLGQQYNGYEIEPGDLVPQGAVIDLIVGSSSANNIKSDTSFVDESLQEDYQVETVGELEEDLF